MKTVALFAVASLVLCVTQASAQTQTAPPLAGPGHDPGVGVSLPLSNKASNIDASNTKTEIAPTLPASSLGTDRSPRAYLQEARDNLVVPGHSGQAQQALEMAETRALSRSVVADQANQPNDSRFIGAIKDARMALGRADNAETIRLIDVALGL